jgi:hypothetical protein
VEAGDDLPTALREAAYVAVGFALIGVQRAQVRRRELARQLPDLEQHLPTGVREAIDIVRTALKG